MTTLSSLQNNDGIQYVWVLCIEGYEKLLTNLADPTDLFTAGEGWASTDWSSAIGGLSVDTDFEQEIVPWSAKDSFSPMSIGLKVVPDSSDTFGVAVFKTADGNETELNADLAADDTTITAVDTSSFTASGTAYLGTERFTYSGTTATTFTGVTRGTLHPFATDGGTANHFAREHTLPDVDYDVHFKPAISDEPRSWVGRWVGLWLHEVVGGSINTKANARLVFAGIMESPEDNPDQSTSFRCVGVREKIRNTVLLRNQFKGRLGEGLRVEAGQKCRASYIVATGAIVDDVTDFEVVASGASGDAQINEGYYTVDELIGKINAWFDSESGTIGDGWEFEITPAADSTNGGHMQLTMDVSSLSLGNGMVFFSMRIPKSWAVAFGWDTFESGTLDGVATARFRETGNTANPVTIYSDRQPGAVIVHFGGANTRITLDSKQGNWIDQGDWMPEPYGTLFTNTEGFLRIGPDIIALARQDPDEAGDDEGLRTFSLNSWVSLANLFGGAATAEQGDTHALIKAGEDGYIEVSQVVVLQGGVKDIIARMFYSTGAANYNHATYDDFDYQLGAGIPGELLGTNFERSLDDLDDGSNQAALTIVLDEPTRMTEVLAPEMALRNSYLIWKDEGLRFVSPQALASALSAHTLTENNKGSAQQGDPQLSPTKIDADGRYMRNVVKVKFNRDLTSGEYLDTVEARYQRSITDHGMAKPITIQARNTYGRWATNGDAVEDALVDLLSQVLPAWGKPLRIMRRTIDSSLYESVAPGDIVTVTDNFARDPATGNRGISGAVGMVLRHSWSLGGDGRDPHGSVDIVFADFSDETIWSPTAQVASYSGTTVTCETNYYSDSSEAADASHFAANDAIVIIEVSPSAAGSAQHWDRTVQSVSGDDIEIDSSLAGYDAGKTYRVISAKYGTAQSTQKVDAYVADDADLRIEDARRPYIWTGPQNSTIDPDAADPTDRCELHYTEMAEDGAPLSSGHGWALAKNCNNLISYGTAIVKPWMWSAATEIQSPASTSWTLLQTGLMYFGPGYLGDQTRKLTLAPFIKSTASGTSHCRVTLGRWAPAGNSLTSVTFTQPYRQLTFTTSSTTWATATPQVTDVPCEPNTGLYWISVEGRKDDGAGELVALGYRGFSVFEQGPLS